MAVLSQLMPPISPSIFIAPPFSISSPRSGSSPGFPVPERERLERDADRVQSHGQPRTRIAEHDKRDADKIESLEKALLDLRAYSTGNLLQTADQHRIARGAYHHVRGVGIAML